MKHMLSSTNTLVIADFDGTLIQKIVFGKYIPSLASLLQHDAKYLGEEGVKETKRLVEHYYPIELDPTLPIDKKTILMQEWWEKCYEILRKYHVTSDMITEVCSSPFVQLRIGLVDFLGFLEQNTIPLLIYSASGIGYDSIEYLLRKNNLLTPNIKVCSNDLLFDEDGYFTHVKPPIIHSANKTGHTLIKNNFLLETPPQRQCLLIGDSIDDVRMVEGINFESVYKVAFGDVDAIEFKKRFDLVLPIDAGYQPIHSLFLD
ncbi:MAG: hypothetical protein V1917_03825 [Candidatus Gottesmanbacteria bacterium]